MDGSTPWSCATRSLSAPGLYQSIVYRVDKASRQLLDGSVNVGVSFYLNAARARGTQKDHASPSLDNYWEFEWGAAWPSAWPVLGPKRQRPQFVASPLREEELAAAQRAAAKAAKLKAMGGREEARIDANIRSLKTAHAFEGRWEPRTLPKPVWVGEQFSLRSPSEIAALVREKIREAQRAGYFPPRMVVAVTSAHKEISVVVEDLDVVVVSEEKVRGIARTNTVGLEYSDSGWRLPLPARAMGDVGRTILSNLDVIVGQYRYDRSDIQSDYFNYNFSYYGARIDPWIVEQQVQIAWPQSAKIKPEVLVDYRLTYGLRRFLDFGSMRRFWAFKDGRSSYVGFADGIALGVDFDGLSEPLLTTPKLPIDPAQPFDDLAHAYELTMALRPQQRR
jgi:hypothetical protein